MLRRVNAGLFEEDDDATIELAVRASNNGGTESAEFDYDSTVLDTVDVDGRPGCRFKVQKGTRQFRALVAFSPGATASARYDLLQMNAAGSLTPVGKSVTNNGGTPLIGFGIAGVAEEEVAAAGVRAKARKRSGPKRKKTMLALTRARRSGAGASTRKKPATARKAKPARPSKAKRTGRTRAKAGSRKKR